MSDWAYTIKVGYSDEFDRWAAQVLDDLGEEVYACDGDTIQEAVGRAAVAIMEVHDKEDEE